MQKKFTSKLVIFMVIGMILIVGAVFITQQIQCQNNFLTSTQSTLEQVAQKLESNEASIANLEANHNANALAKARAFAEMLRLNPEILEDTAKMQEIADLLDVDEVHVTDEKGVLWWGNITGFYGFDFASGEQTIEFLKILEDSSIEIAQEPQPNAAAGTLFQYIGVARTDAKGIVQVGLSPDVLNAALADNEVNKVLGEYALEDGKALFAVSLEDNTLVAHENANLIGRLYTDAGYNKNITSNSNNGEGYFTGTVGGTQIMYSVTKYGDMVIGISSPVSDVYAQRNSQTLLFLAGLLVVFILLIIIINQILRIDIIKGINQIIADLKKITGGDLEVVASVRGNKEFAILSDNINNMVASIKSGFAQNKQIIEENTSIVEEQKNLFKQIKQISAQIKNFSDKTNQLSDVINNSSLEQADCVEMVSQTMEELSSKAIESGEISKKVSGDAYHSSERVEAANTSMQEMKVAMTEIASSSEKIKSIIGNIESIASQTNMLALNASIEAARAGESGRGFAVVAGQVGELAAQSSQAANETNQLIQNALAAIEKGNAITERTSQEFQEIIAETKKVGAEITELVNSFKEQLAAINRASAGVSKIENISKQNIKVVQESEAATEKLVEQADRLNHAVNR